MELFRQVFAAIDEYLLVDRLDISHALLMPRVQLHRYANICDSLADIWVIPQIDTVINQQVPFITVLSFVNILPDDNEISNRHFDRVPVPY